MNVLFNLLRIKGPYMFRALRAHPQEALQRGTWYISCVLLRLPNRRLTVSSVSFAFYIINTCLYTIHHLRFGHPVRRLP
jgi:hypothetical protein